MVQNLGRKLALVFTLLSVSILLIAIGDPPFRMGLDLQGGTRLSYRFDFDDAIRDGTIGENESQSEILQQTIAILRNRVDPDGVLEASIRTEGTNRIVFELPGQASLKGTEAAAPLSGEMNENVRVLELQQGDASAADGFPEGGGLIRIGNEQIRYEGRADNKLTGLTRGHLQTTPVVHALGEVVTLVSDDAIRNAIENLGQLQFLIVATSPDFTGTGTDLASERTLLDNWVAEHPGVDVSNFNRVAVENGGPNALIRWYFNSQTGQPEACLVPVGDWTFRGDALGKVFGTSDSLGYPAVGFEMRPSRVTDFTDFTGENVGRSMAIVLNNEIRTAPNLEERLRGKGIVRGRFTNEEVKELVTVLRTGSLKIKPILEAEEVVGPTLGADYVEKGAFSGILGLSVVLVFMLFYFRRLGAYAAVSLAATMLMLMGGLAFFQATLTLPGIAGIILTVGMAVDANILIFDRIREEMDKGRNIKQAAINGFDHAFSTIIDANVTTFLTGAILYNFGTGPIRGFAVTLMIGIAASVFAALVITRLMVHFSMEKGLKEFNVGQWLVKADYKFLAKSKIALSVSAVMIVVGVALFVSLPNNQKLGIDFLGGGSVMFRTEQAHTIEEVRGLIQGIEGEIGESAVVKPVLSTANGDGYTSFRGVFKIDPDKLNDGDNDAIDSFVSAIRNAIGDKLQQGPVETTMGSTDAGRTSAELRLYFDEAHSTSDIADRLTVSGFEDVSVTEVAERTNTYLAKVVSDLATSELAVTTKVQDAYRSQTDSTGTDFNLSNSIPESNLVGAQVVGELKDKAILALMISLFAIVMYIRVRFAEYSYGFAAVAALVHDVLITLGAISVAMMTGLLEVEINLPMVAAFLTIIGYSLNDT
ncbi:MAG: SecD/SecF fusion protein, partial [Planctomycetota bacterium]